LRVWGDVVLPGRSQEWRIRTDGDSSTTFSRASLGKQGFLSVVFAKARRLRQRGDMLLSTSQLHRRSDESFKVNMATWRCCGVNQYPPLPVRWRPPAHYAILAYLAQSQPEGVATACVWSRLNGVNVHPKEICFRTIVCVGGQATAREVGERDTTQRRLFCFCFVFFFLITSHANEKGRPQNLSYFVSFFFFPHSCVVVGRESPPTPRFLESFGSGFGAGSSLAPVLIPLCFSWCRGRSPTPWALNISRFQVTLC